MRGADHRHRGPGTWLLASNGQPATTRSSTWRAAAWVGWTRRPTNIPHPQLVEDPAGGWWMVTFDGTQFAEHVMGYGGHGDVVLLHST